MTNAFAYARPGGTPVRQDQDHFILIGGRKQGQIFGSKVVQRFNGTSWEPYGLMEANVHWGCPADSGSDVVYILGGWYNPKGFQMYNKVGCFRHWTA